MLAHEEEAAEASEGQQTDEPQNEPTLPSTSGSKNSNSASCQERLTWDKLELSRGREAREVSAAA